MRLGDADAGAAMAFWVTVAIWGIGEQVLRYRDHRACVARQRSEDAGSIFWVIGGVAAGLLAGLASSNARALPLPGPMVWLVIGLTVAWTGLLVRYWAVRTLGPLFTITVVIQPEHRVVSTGPYRFVRHPAYLGLLVFLFGLGVALADVVSVIAMVVLPGIGLARRIAVEEAALRQRLGDSYAAYCAGRARLIPGVW